MTRVDRAPLMVSATTYPIAMAIEIEGRDGGQQRAGKGTSSAGIVTLQSTDYLRSRADRGE